MEEPGDVGVEVGQADVADLVRGPFGTSVGTTGGRRWTRISSSVPSGLATVTATSDPSGPSSIEAAWTKVALRGRAVDPFEHVTGTQPAS